MKSGKISLIGYYGHANTGDEAILTCLISHFRRLGIDKRIVVFSSDPQATAAAHHVETVTAVLPREWYMYIVGLLGRNRRNFYRTIQTFRHASALIMGGGGLFIDRPDTDRFLRELLFKIRWAKNLGQKVILFGVGVGPIYHDRARAELRDTLSRVDLITVRDEESRRLLDDIGVSGPEIFTTADFVFHLDPAPKERIDEIAATVGLDKNDHPKIAICVRRWDAINPAFRDAMATFGRYLINKLGARVWLVPFQTGGGVDDREGARLIIDAIGVPGHTGMIPPIYTPPELMGLIGRTDAIVGEKLHSIIFGINNHRPVLGISYQSKVENLFHEIGHPDWCVDLENLTADRLIERFEPIWQNRDSITREMAAILDTMRVKALLNCEHLRTAAERWDLFPEPLLGDDGCV